MDIKLLEWNVIYLWQRPVIRAVLSLYITSYTTSMCLQKYWSNSSVSFAYKNPATNIHYAEFIGAPTALSLLCFTLLPNLHKVKTVASRAYMQRSWRQCKCCNFIKDAAEMNLQLATVCHAWEADKAHCYSIVQTHNQKCFGQLSQYDHDYGMYGHARHGALQKMSSSATTSIWHYGENSTIGTNFI